MQEYTYCTYHILVQNLICFSLFSFVSEANEKRIVRFHPRFPRIVPSGSFLSSYIYHLFIISKQKTYHTFVSYGILVLNPRLSFPSLFSVVGMAEMLGWEPRYGCYISLLFLYLNSSFPIFMQSLSIAFVLCLLGPHCQGTKNWICIMTDVKMMVEG